MRRLQREAFGRERDTWTLDHSFHFGGYAKRTPDLGAFIANFRARHGITLDWVYEAKMMYGLFRRITIGAFAPWHHDHRSPELTAVVVSER